MKRDWNVYYDEIIQQHHIQIDLWEKNRLKEEERIKLFKEWDIVSDGGFI